MSLTLLHVLNRAQEEELWHLYEEESSWTRGRTQEDVALALAGSDLVVALVDGDGGLAAFARVLTDGVYKAILLDVIVAQRWRGEGLGRRLMDAILSHPDLARVRDFELYCDEEMVPFYEQWGFTSDLGSLRFLRRVSRGSARTRNG